MNYQIRAFQLSIIVHVVAIILLIMAGNHFASKQERLLVVDFTLSDSSGPLHRLSVVNPGKHKSTGSEAEFAKQEREVPLPEPEKPQPVKQEAVPVEEVKAPLVTLQVPAVTQNEKAAYENVVEEDTPGASSAHETDKTLASGNGTKGISAGNSKSSYGAAGIGYLKSNFSYVRDLIMKKMIYPERAREMGWQGKVKVSFVVCSDGFVKDVRILESSGVAILDKNAVETVKKASPFPRPPVAAQLIMPISYRLR